MVLIPMIIWVKIFTIIWNIHIFVYFHYANWWKGYWHLEMVQFSGGPHEHNNEPLGYIKCGVFPDYLRNYLVSSVLTIGTIC